MVMAAMGSDCENLGPAVYQQDLLVAHMTCELSIQKLCERNALGQIGAAGRGSLLRHVSASARIRADRRVDSEHRLFIPGARKHLGAWTV
jgi:hypothetical protein